MECRQRSQLYSELIPGALLLVVAFLFRRVFMKMLELVLHIQQEVLWHQHTMCVRVMVPPVGRYLYVVMIIYAMIL